MPRPRHERTISQRLDSIEHALYGPPEESNGVVSYVCDVRRRLRRVEVGVAVVAVATLSPRVGGPTAPDLIAAVAQAITNI